MVYIKRGSDKHICAIYSTNEDGSLENVDINSPEVAEFLIQCDRELQLKFLQSDLQLIRVLEDLIDILIEKNIVTITDFPQPVINKLLARQSFRMRYDGVSGMEYDLDDDEEK